MKLGILAAMPDEVNTMHNDFHFHEVINHAEREYHLGKVNNAELVLVFSRVGKVSASVTATTLIEKFNVDKIIFTGVAGAVSSDLTIGDIVLADKAYQHDMNGSPMFPQFEIPLTGRALFELDYDELKQAQAGINNFINKLEHYVDLDDLAKLNIAKPKLHIGTIATGDQFIQNAASHTNLNKPEMQALAVEMEGAAVAQVCAEHQIPYTLIRTISDQADHSATVNFQDFIAKVASHYSSGIIQEILKLHIPTVLTTDDK